MATLENLSKSAIGGSPAISALLTTTMLYMKDAIELPQEEGMRDQARVIIGGASISQDFAHKIGADGYTLRMPLRRRTSVIGC